MNSAVIFLQDVLGFSAMTTGMMGLPFAFAVMIVGPFSGRLTDRINGKYVMLAGSVLLVLGLAYTLHVFALDNTVWSFVAPLGICGVGCGMIFAPLTTLAMRNVRPSMANAASAFTNTVRQIGAALGSAIIGALLANTVADNAVPEASKLTWPVPAQYRAVILQQFRLASHGSRQIGQSTFNVSAIVKSLNLSVSQELALKPQLPALLRTAHLAYGHAFLDGMHVSMLMPVIAGVLGVAVAAALRGGRTADAARGAFAQAADAAQASAGAHASGRAQSISGADPAKPAARPARTSSSTPAARRDPVAAGARPASTSRPSKRRKPAGKHQ